MSEADDVELWVRVTDEDEPNTNLEFRWSSDLTGELFARRAVTAETGNETIVWPNPPPGDHLLTVEAWDTGNGSGQATVAIEVTPNSPPTCTIITPTAGSRLTLSANGFMNADGHASDLETPVSDLDIRWEDESGNLLGEGNPGEDGVFLTGMQARSGAMTLVLRVTDPLGLECLEAVAFTTNFRPTAPEVTLSPDPPSIFEDLVAAVSVVSTDPDGPDASITYRYAWKTFDL